MFPDPQLTVYDDSYNKDRRFFESDKNISFIETGYWGKFLLPGFFKTSQPITKKIIRKAIQKTYIDNGIGWIIPALQACRRIRLDDVEVIMATGAPYSAFVIAALLAKQLRCPYVLDYRDPWTSGPHHKKPYPKIYKRIESFLDRKAAAITCVSESWSVGIRSDLGLEKPIHTISNGFDPEEASGVEPMVFDQPAVVYAGRFYPPKRVITPVLEAVVSTRSAIAEPRKRPVLHYFGADEKHLQIEAMKLGDRGSIICHGNVPRVQVLSAMKGAAAVVVVTSVKPESDVWERGIITGKIFEPINTGTPVLLVAPRLSDARTIIESSDAGCAFVGTEIKEMSFFIKSLCEGGKKMEASALSQQYSWSKLSDKLDIILRQCLR